MRKLGIMTSVGQFNHFYFERILDFPLPNKDMRSLLFAVSGLNQAQQDMPGQTQT